MKITWLKESKKGIRCGILGCIGKPVWECPVCGAWYCEEHKEVHFHFLSEHSFENKKEDR